MKQHFWVYKNFSLDSFFIRRNSFFNGNFKSDIRNFFIASRQPNIFLCLGFHLKNTFCFALFFQKLLRLNISSLLKYNFQFVSYKKQSIDSHCNWLVYVWLFAEINFRIGCRLSFVEKSKKKTCQTVTRARGKLTLRPWGPLKSNLSRWS